MGISRKVAWIIDDAVDLCLLMKSYFLRKNYEVRISHTCTEVRYALEQGIVPDIVLFDASTCNHPEEIIKNIRKVNPDVQVHISG